MVREKIGPDNLKPLKPFPYLSFKNGALDQELWLCSRGLLETWRIMITDLGTVVIEKLND